MKVEDIEKMIILNASPRNKGICSQIINKLTEEFTKYIPLSKIKIVNIYDLNIEYCNNCDFCAKHRGCAHDDDMTILYKDFNEANLIFVVSPIYFNSIPAPFKTLVDRLQAVYNSKYELNDPIIDRNKKRNSGFYLVGGQEYTEDQFTGAIEILKIFFKAINSKCEYGYGISNTNKSSNLKDNIIFDLKL